MLGCEKHDKRLKNDSIQFQQAAEKYKKQGYTLDTTGNSLVGALATHVNRSFPIKCKKI